MITHPTATCHGEMQKFKDIANNRSCIGNNVDTVLHVHVCKTGIGPGKTTYTTMAMGTETTVEHYVTITKAPKIQEFSEWNEYIYSSPVTLFPRL